MKPINQKERSALYIQFLAIYLVTIVIIILSVHFNNEASSAEGDALRKMNDDKRKMTENTRIYFSKMNKVDSLLKAMEDPKANADRLSDDIKSQISDMKTLVAANPSVNDSVYTKIYDRYYDVLQDKRLIQQGNSSTQAVTSLQQKLTKATTDLDECNKLLNTYKAMAGGSK